MRAMDEIERVILHSIIKHVRDNYPYEVYSVYKNPFRATFTYRDTPVAKIIIQNGQVLFNYGAKHYDNWPNQLMSLKLEDPNLIETIESKLNNIEL